MSKLTLNRMIHDFNMAWRQFLSAEWRLRLTADGGIYTLWTGAGIQLLLATSLEEVYRMLLDLNEVWAENLPA